MKSDAGGMPNLEGNCEGRAVGAIENVTIAGDGRDLLGGRLCQLLKGNGQLVSETRNVAAFVGLRVTAGFSVELVRAPQAVQLSLDENLLSHVSTNVQQGVLIVADTPASVLLLPSPAARIFVSSPSLSLIDAEGAASVRGGTAGSSLTLTASGSSSLMLDLELTGELRANASGSSSVHLAGTAAHLHASASGAASLEAVFPVGAAEISASGSARVSVVATESVTVHAGGASMVTVHGEPARRTVETTGAASVVFAD
ncbi:MAG TPA: DUF2807 domain-containing protein [Polyangiales bacterium]